MASAGKIYDNRQDDPERAKLEGTERLSERGAYAATADKGAHQAARPFHGTGKAGPGSGRAAVQIIGVLRLAEMIAAFRARTDQKKIELRSRNAGKRPRKDIKDRLGDKE